MFKYCGKQVEIEKIKKQYTSKIEKHEEKIRKAEHQVGKQKSMANQKKVDAAVSTGTAIFGALLTAFLDCFP